MVFLDTAGSATWPSWYSFATAGLKPMDAVPIEPVNGIKVPSLTPTLQALISNQAPPSSVEWQVSTVNTFASTVWTTTQTSVNDGVRQALLTTTLTNATTYYWRVRTGDGLGAWGGWSATQTFQTDLNAGRGYQEMYQNIGREVAIPQLGTQQTYENVGIAPNLKALSAEYMYENVGVPIRRSPDSVEFMYLGDVSNNTPTPIIWFLQPTAGRDGDGFKIFGFGAGALQSDFSALVERFQPGVGWVSVPVITWTVYPPTANAYTSARVLDPATGLVDMQHLVIELVIPAGSLPPGYGLRIRTNGP